MSFEYPSDIPSSALLLHSEPINPQDPPSESYSDDIRAIDALKEEDQVQKTRNGVVIQHRSWKLLDVFRSDENYAVGQKSFSLAK
jgi:chromosome transmission fidelity protein 18